MVFSLSLFHIHLAIIHQQGRLVKQKFSAERIFFCGRCPLPSMFLIRVSDTHVCQPCGKRLGNQHSRSASKNQTGLTCRFVISVSGRSPMAALRALRAAMSEPNQVHKCTWCRLPGRVGSCPGTKRKDPTFVGSFLFGIRQRPTLPGRLQPSTIGAERLNFCVRYGNRWAPFAITTGIF